MPVHISHLPFKADDAGGSWKVGRCLNTILKMSGSRRDAGRECGYDGSVFICFDKWKLTNVKCPMKDGSGFADDRLSSYDFDQRGSPVSKS